MEANALEKVLWLGGPPSSGKTSVATRIARRHGLRWYSADTRTWAHRDRAVAQGNRAAIQLDAMTQEQRSGPGRVELELSLHRDRGPMVVDDLRSLPQSPLVVAEGTTLQAGAVHDHSRSVWLIPTREFQQARFDERGIKGGAGQLFARLTEMIERDARDHKVPILVVDGSRGVEEITAAVEDHFAGALAEGPRVHSPEERRALLREANEAAVVQVRGFFARPWAKGDPDDVIRTFLCECGDPSCTATVETRVAVAARAPVLAEEHNSGR